MTCKNCNIKPVWEFTNQTKLCENCFKDYFERKAFRTIRKFSMLPKDKIIKLKTSKDINTQVSKHVLEKKFTVNFSSNPNFSSENLSQIAEETFSNILKGKFKGKKPEEKPFKPLYFLSDKEIELYAKLTNIKGETLKKNKKIQTLFQKFFEKNPDLEHNIINAYLQL